LSNFDANRKPIRL